MSRPTSSGMPRRDVRARRSACAASPALLKLMTAPTSPRRRLSRSRIGSCEIRLSWPAFSSSVMRASSASIRPSTGSAAAAPAARARAPAASTRTIPDTSRRIAPAPARDGPLRPRLPARTMPETKRGRRPSPRPKFGASCGRLSARSPAPGVPSGASAPRSRRRTSRGRARHPWPGRAPRRPGGAGSRGCRRSGSRPPCRR